MMYSKKKLRDIASTSKRWITEQATNCRLVGSWDNFKFRVNVQGERVGDTVKFRSITMALWIRNGRRSPKNWSKQWMCSPKMDRLNARTIVNSFLADNQRSQCIRHHRFVSFIFVFPNCSFSYSAAMPRVNIIECKTFPPPNFTLEWSRITSPLFTNTPTKSICHIVTVCAQTNKEGFS